MSASIEAGILATSDSRDISTQSSAGLDQPRILREVVYMEDEEGVLVDGLAKLEYIRGPLAQTILPRLIELMDGTRSRAQIVGAFPGIPEANINSAISLLEQWGLIDSSPTVEQNNASDTLAFIKRYLAGSGGDRSVAETWTQLRAACIVVLTSEEHLSDGDRLSALLERAGIRARVVKGNAFRPGEVPKGALVTCLGNVRGGSSLVGLLEQRRLQNEFSWLRATLDHVSALAEVGPIFLPGDHYCYDCFSAVHGGTYGEVGSGPVAAANHAAWLSHIAMEVIAGLAMPHMALGQREFRRYRLSDWSVQTLKYPRLPGCSRCRPIPLCQQKRKGSSVVTDTALVFEEHVGLESRAVLNRVTAESISSERAVLHSDSKRLPNCKQVALPSVTISSDLRVVDVIENRNDRRGKLSIEQLAALLALTAGIREIGNGQTRRWAATAGNLGSVELFVVAENVEQIDRGAYFYQAREHQLAQLRTIAGENASEFMRRIIGANDRPLPDLLVIFTGALHRLVPKYGSFGYRLTNLDAGACMSQLQLIARSMNLWSQTARQWPDDLIESGLHLAYPDELCTGVVEISRKPSRRTRKFWFKSPLGVSWDDFASWKEARQLDGLGTKEITELVIKESRLQERQLHRQPRNLEEEFPVPEPGNPKVNLPRPVQDGASLISVLEKRRSVRRFGKGSVALGHLGTALRLTHEADLREWQHEDKAESSLEFLVLAKRVLSLEAGVYEYRAGVHRLAHLRSALSEKEITALLVQTEFGDAACIIWITGDLRSACSRHGAFGERQLLLRAGAAGHRLWMCLLSFGLSGSMLAGLVPGAARDILGLDGYRKASLFAAALGHAAEDATAESG